MDLQGSQNLPQKFAAHFYLTVNVSYQINAHHPTKAVQVIKGEQVIFDETGKLHTRLKIDNTFSFKHFCPPMSYIPFQRRAYKFNEKRIWRTLHSVRHGFLPVTEQILGLRQLPLCFPYDLASHIPRPWQFISILTCRNTIPSGHIVGLNTFCDNLVTVKYVCLQKSCTPFKTFSFLKCCIFKNKFSHFSVLLSVMAADCVMSIKNMLTLWLLPE